MPELRGDHHRISVRVVAEDAAEDLLARSVGVHVGGVEEVDVVRSDAVENRARIVAAARRAFAENGAASMNQIAQGAAVGAGTLYRHFPTREALVLAVYADEVERIVGSVPGLLDAHRPLEALRVWTLDLVEAMRRKHGLGDALSPAAHQSITEQSHDPVIKAITRLMDAGKAEGSVRADADPGDFLQLTAALWRAAPGPEDRAPRMLQLILDGLRPPAEGPEPLSR